MSSDTNPKSGSQAEPARPSSGMIEKFKYDNRIVRAFAIATVVWAIVGMSAGLLAAVELFWPAANLNLQFITFGRLRPLCRARIQVRISGLACNTK